MWAGEHKRWTRRDLSAKRYVYFWADGVYYQPRLEHDKQCPLVIIGADEIVRSRHVVGSPRAEFLRLKSAHERQLAAALALPESVAATPFSLPPPEVAAAISSCRTLRTRARSCGSGCAPDASHDDQALGAGSLGAG